MRLVSWVPVAHTLEPFSRLGPGLKPLEVLTHAAGQRLSQTLGRLSRPAAPSRAQKQKATFQTAPAPAGNEAPRPCALQGNMAQPTDMEEEAAMFGLLGLKLTLPWTVPQSQPCHHLQWPFIAQCLPKVLPGSQEPICTKHPLCSMMHLLCSSQP